MDGLASLRQGREGGQGYERLITTPPPRGEEQERPIYKGPKIAFTRPPTATNEDLFEAGASPKTFMPLSLSTDSKEDPFEAGPSSPKMPPKDKKETSF